MKATPFTVLVQPGTNAAGSDSLLDRPVVQQLKPRIVLRSVRGGMVGN